MQSIEVWVDVAGYEGCYQVSNYGRVKSVQRTRPFYINGNGYCIKGEGRKYIRPVRERILVVVTTTQKYSVVSLCKKGKIKQKRIHILVASAFIPNPLNKPEVNHIDGKKWNCHVSNLEWCTKQENHTHAAKIGLKAKGSRNGGAKLKDADIPKIRKMLKDGYTALEIAPLFGVTRGPIDNIKRGKKWQHIP